MKSVRINKISEVYEHINNLEYGYKLLHQIHKNTYGILPIIPSEIINYELLNIDVYTNLIKINKDIIFPIYTQKYFDITEKFATIRYSNILYTIYNNIITTYNVDNKNQFTMFKNLIIKDDVLIGYFGMNDKIFSEVINHIKEENIHGNRFYYNEFVKMLHNYGTIVIKKEYYKGYFTNITKRNFTNSFIVLDELPFKLCEFHLINKLIDQNNSIKDITNMISNLIDKKILINR